MSDARDPLDLDVIEARIREKPGPWLDREKLALVAELRVARATIAQLENERREALATLTEALGVAIEAYDNPRRFGNP